MAGMLVEPNPPFPNNLDFWIFKMGGGADGSSFRHRDDGMIIMAKSPDFGNAKARFIEAANSSKLTNEPKARDWIGKRNPRTIG